MYSTCDIDVLVYKYYIDISTLYNATCIIFILFIIRLIIVLYCISIVVIVRSFILSILC